LNKTKATPTNSEAFNHFLWSLEWVSMIAKEIILLRGSMLCTSEEMRKGCAKNIKQKGGELHRIYASRACEPSDLRRDKNFPGGSKTRIIVLFTRDPATHQASICSKERTEALALQCS
jgi:hypothetical protein